MAKTTAEEFYNSVTDMYLVNTCISTSIPEWEGLMEGTKKASYRKIHKLIKQFCPDMVDLTWNNPYKYQYRRKENLIVVVHSAIEYFFEV